MLDVMDAITSRVPAAVSTLYVDDICTEITGGPRQVARTLAAAASVLHDEVKKIGLELKSSMHAENNARG